MVVRDEKGGELRPLDLFLSIGLDKRTAENVLVNPKVTSNLTAVIKEAYVVDGCSKAVGNLLYTVAIKRKFSPISGIMKLINHDITM